MSSPTTEAADLPRSTPEAQGVPSTAIAAFLDGVEREVHHLHSLMLVRHGHVLAEGWWEPYRPESPHMLFSLSKSFTSSAIGLLVAEGRLDIDAPVLDFFPDEAPGTPGDNLRAMRVRHLLSMSTGHVVEPLQRVTGGDRRLRSGVDWARAFMEEPVEYAPGTHFLYNSMASYMLSAVVQRITGMRMLEYLRPRLFEPLGIENPTWQTSPQGIDAGGFGLSATTAAIARFGQLYLQRGAWQGRQLLPEAWVQQATAYQVDNAPSFNPDWEQGYGYQFWRCRHGAYRGDGAFGQFCLVLPDQDAVMSITAGTQTMQEVLDLIWEHLLPAMAQAPLDEDPAARGVLARRLAELRLEPPAGARSSGVGAEVSGRTYRIAANDDGIEAIEFSFEDGGIARITIRDGHGAREIACGYGGWLRGQAAFDDAEPSPVAVAGAWTDERTYVARMWWYETPFAWTLTCRFHGERLIVEQARNVSFPSPPRPHLAGRVA